MTAISPPPAVPLSNRRGALALALPLLVVAGCLLFYAGLTPLGYWTGDEFLAFRAFEAQGLSGLVARLVKWSPRPFSEALLYVYMFSVMETGRQLIAPMLGALWFLMALSIVLPAALVGRSRVLAAMTSTVVLGGVIVQPLSNQYFHDAFFWIQGAVAYMPTIAALLSVLALLCFGSTRSRALWIVVTVLLVVTATASEVGAFFVLLFGSLLLAIWVGGFLPTERFRLYRSVPPTAALLPFIVAAIVVLFLFFGRLGEPLEATNDVLHTAHRISASLVTALATIHLDLIGQRSQTGTGTWLSAALVPKLLFAAGAILMFAAVGSQERRRNRWPLLAFGAAAAGTAFLTLFAGYYQFGNTCCGRHEMMRELLGLLSVTSFAALASTFLHRAESNLALGIGGCVIALAGVLAIETETPRLQASYARYDVTRDTMARNWLAMHEQGPTMAYTLRGDTYSGEFGWTVGAYQAGQTELPVPVRHMMRLFGKERVDVLPALPTP